MSDAGDPCGVNCEEVLDAVYLYLDGEADETRTAIVREHLDDCVSCLRAYGDERRVQQLVARCCGNDRAPDELRLKVMSRIRTVSVEVERVEFRLD